MDGPASKNRGKCPFILPALAALMSLRPDQSVHAFMMAGAMRLKVAKLWSPFVVAQDHVPAGRPFGLTFQNEPMLLALQLAVFAVAFYIAYRFGMSFSQAAASPFWFPDSVLLCALLMAPPRSWWLFILVPLPIRLFSEVSQGIPLWFLLATYAIDSGKGLIAALILRRYIGPSFRLHTVRELLAFFLFAVLFVPAVGGLFGAAARAALGHDYWSAWEQWFLGNALAHLVVTPVILYWVLGVSWRARLPNTKRMLEAGALAAGLLIAGYASTNTGPSSIDFAGARFYAPVPFMFWAAIRFGMAGASGAIGITALLTVHGALNGRGPFSDLSPSDITLALQNFLLLRAAPLYLVAAVIEQRKDVEVRLRESEQRFRNMANTAPVLLWISGRDGSCEFVNQGWLAFTGRSSPDVTGDGWLNDVHPEDRPHCAEIYRAALDARQPFEMEYRLRRHDGEYRWVMHKGVLRRPVDGKFLGYIGSVVDITDRKQVEEGARILSHTQRLVLMGELSAAIAHEVKQPLTAILSNADAAAMLLNTAHPPLDEIREIIADIRDDDLRANEVVTRIREFLRAQTPSAEMLDVNGCVADALRHIAGDLRRRRIQIQAEFGQALPPISADRTQLQQVLINLLVNGMDAMEGVSGGPHDLMVRTGLNCNGVEIAISDRGCGIAEDRLPRLFEAFFTTKKDGMGLGLSIARSIVTAHHGRIWADNNPDGGATFHVVLPAAEGHEP
jgi:PAS domain S-box-containing protein